MHRVPRTRLTLPAVAGRLSEGLAVTVPLDGSLNGTHDSGHRRLDGRFLCLEAIEPDLSERQVHLRRDPARTRSIWSRAAAAEVLGASVSPERLQGAER